MPTKEQRKAQGQRYYQKHKEEIREKSKKRDKIKEYERKKAYRINNLEKAKTSSRRYYQENREKILARQKAYIEANYSKVRERERKCREAAKDKIRARNRARIYSITIEQANQLSAITHCEICDCLLSDRDHCVDHNHQTGLVRGVLCSRCNKVLAFARDNVGTLRSAIKYLQKHSKIRKERAAA